MVPDMIDLTDEQRVALWLAIRMTNPTAKSPRTVTYGQIEDGCSKFWRAVGVARFGETWSRAFRRAKRAGMLGYVEDGGAFLPIHCASACFGGSDAFIKLVGGRFKSHETGVFTTTIVAPDHPVIVFYTEQPETLQFLTFARRRWVTLENDPSRLDLAKVRAAGVRQEFVVENDRRFKDLFQRLESMFPGAQRTYLRDVRRPAEGIVAFILDVPPASGRPPGDEALPGAGGAPAP